MRLWKLTTQQIVEARLIIASYPQVHYAKSHIGLPELYIIYAYPYRTLTRNFVFNWSSYQKSWFHKGMNDFIVCLSINKDS